MKDNTKELIKLFGLGAIMMLIIVNVILGSAYFWISILK